MTTFQITDTQSLGSFVTKRSNIWNIQVTTANPISRGIYIDNDVLCSYIAILLCITGREKLPNIRHSRSFGSFATKRCFNLNIQVMTADPIDFLTFLIVILGYGEQNNLPTNRHRFELLLLWFQLKEVITSAKPFLTGTCDMFVHGIG